MIVPFIIPSRQLVKCPGNKQTSGLPQEQEPCEEYRSITSLFDDCTYYA